MENPVVFHKNILISGRVQGVGFRYNARSMARTFHINGFIRNMPNGDVYIEVEGLTEPLMEFIDWCRQGPPHARVDHLDITNGMLTGFTEFIVK